MSDQNNAQAPNRYAAWTDVEINDNSSNEVLQSHLEDLAEATHEGFNPDLAVASEERMIKRGGIDGRLILATAAALTLINAVKTGGNVTRRNFLGGAVAAGAALVLGRKNASAQEPGPEAADPCLYFVQDDYDVNNPVYRDGQQNKMFVDFMKEFDAEFEARGQDLILGDVIDVGGGFNFADSAGRGTPFNLQNSIGYILGENNLETNGQYTIRLGFKHPALVKDWYIKKGQEQGVNIADVTFVGTVLEYDGLETWNKLPRILTQSDDAELNLLVNDYLADANNKEMEHIADAILVEPALLNGRAEDLGKGEAALVAYALAGYNTKEELITLLRSNREVVKGIILNARLDNVFSGMVMPNMIDDGAGNLVQWGIDAINSILQPIYAEWFNRRVEMCEAARAEDKLATEQ